MYGVLGNDEADRISKGAHIAAYSNVEQVRMSTSRSDGNAVASALGKDISIRLWNVPDSHNSSLYFLDPEHRFSVPSILLKRTEPVLHRPRLGEAHTRQ